MFMTHHFPLTASHNFHHIDDSIHMLPGGHDALQQKILKITPQLRVQTADDIDKFRRQFEWWLLETYWMAYRKRFGVEYKMTAPIDNNFTKIIPKFFGDMLKMKPKSMWIIWPSECNRMLPLCLIVNGRNVILVVCERFSLNWMDMDTDWPVFDLQQVTNQTICRTALHKIVLCHSKLFTVWIAVFIDEIFA